LWGCAIGNVMNRVRHTISITNVFTRDREKGDTIPDYINADTFCKFIYIY
jgi:hypothetical protein